MMASGSNEGFRAWEGDIVLARGPLRVDPQTSRETLELVRRFVARMGPVLPDRDPPSAEP